MTLWNPGKRKLTFTHVVVGDIAAPAKSQEAANALIEYWQPVYDEKEIYTLEAEIGEAAGGYTLSGHLEDEGLHKLLELHGF